MFQPWFQGDHRQLRLNAYNALHDCAGQGDAHGCNQSGSILSLVGIVRDGFGNAANVADRHLLCQQGLQHFEQLRQAQNPRHQLFGQLGRGLGQQLHQLLHFFLTNQLMGVLVQNLVQVSGHHSAGIHYGIAQRLRLTALADFDPHGFQTKGRVFGGDPVEGAEYLPRVDRQLAIGVDLGLGQNHPHQGQTVGAGGQIEVVADVHGGHQKAQVLRQLFTHALDPCQQLPTLIAVHQRNQAVTDFQPDHVDGRYVIPAQFLALLGAGRRRQQLLLALHFLQGLDLDHVLFFPHQVRHAPRNGGQAQEREVRHARHNPHDRH